MARIAHPERKRAGVFKHRKVNGEPVCIDCGDPAYNSFMGVANAIGALRCRTCSQHRHWYTTILSGRAFAGSAVAKARRDGRLSPPSDHQCADCGRPAEQYDHRDYNKPLDVQPVCRSCNVMRGCAIPFNPLLVGLLLLAAAGSSASRS